MPPPVAMTCCLSEEAKLQKRVNEEIERQLNREWFEARRESKFLLLGPEEAGKTTFLKQVRLIQEGDARRDRVEHVRSVFQALIGALQRIVRAMDALGIPYKNPSNVENAMLVLSVRCETLEPPLTEPVSEALRRLWEDAGVRECYERRAEYGGLPPFLPDVHRVTCPGYVPSREDYLRVRTPSRGVLEYPFLLDECPVRLVDVGEQRSEPKKWIHCFQDVSAVIFVAPLSDYDDPGKMERARALFSTIVSSPWFAESHLLLLLNKKDLLEQKIERAPLGAYFPAYRGPPGDPKAAREFIRRTFADLNPERPVYFFFTCAIDTDDIRYVMPTLREIACLRSFPGRGRQPSDASSNAEAAVAAATAFTFPTT
ncbi:guanine nucleotide-binding protein G(q) subunit alpha-like [Ornithodoros turicata]|uniref:guanine nucleotide-binding protein G(q) subunit alpha-like n=1 Tax=Ornithodoros turicata TaxID=34597 RepID=UPI00313880E5